MDINNIYNVMKQLENESSKNSKEAILKQNEGNTDFRDALTFLLNPYIVTGISTKKINKKIAFKETTAVANIDSFSFLLRHLENNNSGKDTDIYAIQRYVNSLENDELKTFVTKFVTKTLKLGISEKTVNKVYGEGTIPTFAVMLAESFEKKKDKVKGKFYITLKLDGNRCIAIVEDCTVKFFSRKGQEIESMVELEEQFSRFPDGVYDGEVLLVNKDNLPSDELFRATQKVIRKDGEKKGLEFYIFDTVTISEFKDGKSKRTYEQRRNILNTVVVEFTKETKNVHMLEVLYEGEDKEQIPAWASAVEAMGHEGVMVNTASGLYQTKRVNDLLKVKSFMSADGVVLGVYEGSGKYEGKLGGVLISYKDKAVRIGSGFTDEERKKYWEDKDSVIGKVAQYNYFEESQNQNGGYDLRFATWKGIREDKGVEDVNYE